MSFSTDHKLLINSAPHFAHVINHINAGIWEYSVNTGEVKWSDGFYRILGYEPGEIACSYAFFYENLLYHGDRKAFNKSIFDRTDRHTSTIQIRLLTKQSGYQWFENTSRVNDDAEFPMVYGTITNINPFKIAVLQSAHQDKLYYEGNKIAKIAIWELHLKTMELTLSKEGFDIFELDNPVKLTVDELISFFEPQFREKANEAVQHLIDFCKSFDMELLCRNAKNKVTWLRFKAVPIIDDFGKCITIKGILQDIDQPKRREITLQSSLNLANDQNKRLQNFAYIVSHNLRSHTGNLQFMVNLYNETKTEEERTEIFEHIRSISDSLNTTVKHLEEVVKIQAEINKDKKVIDFESVFNKLLSALAHNIEEVNAKVEFDFSQCPQIEYIPAYMESILQNMLTNALKYRAANRLPLIKCHTYTKNSHVYLVFEDNGMGIDMAKHGDDIFGMYKTFHTNSDAKGIGLFITRNQIESLGGSIKIESAVDKGTKFIIRLN